MASNFQQSYQCQYCAYIGNSLLQRLDHCKFVHSNKPGFEITCQVDGCPKKYQNVKSLYYHIKSKHAFAAQTLFQRNRVPTGRLDVLQVPDDCETEHCVPPSNDENNSLDTEGGPLPLVQHNYFQEHGMFLLSMKEFNKVPQSACNKIADQMQSTVELSNENLGDRIQKILQEKGCVTAEDISLAVAEQNACAADACEGLNSGYKLDKFAKSRLNVVDPEDIILGIGDDGKPRTMQYVPILQSLQQLLKHEDVMSQVLSGHSSQDGRLRDFCDGSLYKENALFKNDPTALQIQLYNDEFCVANALGFRQRKWKINAIYYILGNLEPKHRSRLDMVQLVCLAKNIHVKKFGLLSLLEPVIYDIKKLEVSGIVVHFEDKAHHFYGTVSFTSADNLAAHFLARLPENFSTVLRLCRVCNITKQQLPITTDANQCELRTRQSYDIQAALAERNPELAKLYGVKGKSPLNSLKFYHVIDGLPPCLHHDLFEGQGPDLFERIVVIFVQQGYFTLEQFQLRVNDFPYMGSDKANKPALISIDKVKLRFTQSITWCFLRLCPLMIGDLIPEDHPLWRLATLFLDVLDQVLSPVISQRDIHYMQQVIEDFLTEFRNNFPGTRIKPKGHYMLHYPTLTKKFGPLVHVGTQRFDAKHDAHKQKAARSKNKINICKTMAKGHQTRQALFHAKENILDGAHYTSCVGVEDFPVQLLDSCVRSTIEPYLNGNPQVAKLKAVTVSGTKYSVELAVVLSESHGQYEFGRIEHIFIISGKPYLCCRKLVVHEFSEHYHSYSVGESQEFVLVQVKDLLDYHPLGLYHLHGKTFITLKYKLACI